MRRLELLIPVVDNFGEFQWKDNAQTLLCQYVTASAEAIENDRKHSTKSFSPQIYTLFIKNTNFSWQCTRCLTQIKQIGADFYVKLRQLEQL